MRQKMSYVPQHNGTFIVTASNEILNSCYSSGGRW